MQARRDDLRIAIIGAGPAGCYAADALLGTPDIPPLRIDIVDRVPTPFGLVRYGVAPDHLSIRSVRDTLDRILDSESIRFVGGVEVGDAGADLSLDEIRRCYDAVILSYGASRDRALGIPGEDLPGSISATEFVRWYTGHPDTRADAYADLLRRARRVAVLGVGNVAVDVTRVLAKTRAELEHTDMPEHVLEALDSSAVEEIHLIGRRGPAEASWTTKELRELGELTDARVLVDPRDLVLGPSSRALVDTDKVAARNVAVVQEWADRDASPSARTVHVRFFQRPVAIEGTPHGVSALVVERTRLDEDGSVTGTGDYTTIDVDMVIRSVGYRGEGLADVPFDVERGVIPHQDGRVMAAGRPVPGLYTAGWIKRGPSGIIGTNKKDAVNTVESLVADLREGRLPPRRSDDDPIAGRAHVDLAGWRRIDAAERHLGGTRSRDRTTIHDRDEALRLGATRP